ncbi:hypothetical protein METBISCDRAFT_22588 [Metschnikowia bicuspidata]|uniref:E3 ubiquitin-protein ligase PEP5 n=1 Tax=Metschnikowia bicuspidata TaxID=27322 RepID=A0A4P9ZE73_9ASCO|nr:hypothetical protein METBISCDRAFT_22588 [Metschnikowia bicuspidata]
MSLPSTWRHFQLFDFLPIRDPNYQSDSPLYSDPLLSAICNTQTFIAFAVHNCDIILLSKQLLEHVTRFCAYDIDYCISFARALPHSNLLVTIAEKQGSPAHLKLWDLNKMVLLILPDTGVDDFTQHKYVTHALINDGANAYPISCFTFNESLTCIAVGYTSGKVMLVRGDLLRDRGLKQRIIYGSPDPITGIHFNRFEQILYVTTTSKIITVLTTGRNKGKALRVLSHKKGVDLDCSDIEPRSAMLIVADTEGFSFYNDVNKAHEFNFNIPKRKILRLFKDYLLVVAPIYDFSNTSRKTVTRLLVLDMKNMHISFSLTIPSLTISHVFFSATENEAYLLSTDGVLYKLHEKAINQQIEIILQRGLFSIALSMAKQHNLNNETLYRINLLNADTLYEKQDYDGAIEKYIDCIPLVQKIQANNGANTDIQSSMENMDDFIINVITNFKEVSNIHNMTKFLAKLYELRLSDSDHITLLLCCYCKLKMTDELDKFIEGIDLQDDQVISNKLDLSKLKFSLIINLFKECGYYVQVTKLLYKLNHPHLIVEIQLEDLKQYENCMSYINSLPINELLRILIDFLNILLDCMPIETTELLIDVFTGKYKPNLTHLLFESPKRERSKADDEKKAVSEANVSSYTAFLSYLASPLKQGAEEDAAIKQAELEAPTYLPPRPSLVFPCFINHPKQFIVFLEACLESIDKYQGNDSQRKELLMTLFELYLSMSVEDSENTEKWLSNATSILREQSNFLDKPRVLLLAHIYLFQAVRYFAQDSEQDFGKTLFRSAQMRNDVPHAFEIVRKHGEMHPQLFMLMLKFLLSSKENFASVSHNDKQYLLKSIAKHDVATPLELVEMLSTHESASIGLVKDLIIDHVGRLNRDIENNLKLVESYENESTVNSYKLTELTSKPFIIQNAKCSSCELKLDFPAIHFRCQHSYHSQCLNATTYMPETISGEKVCLLCASDFAAGKSTRSNQLKSANDYETFAKHLDESSDRFKVIIEYFGRGIMEANLAQPFP